MIDVAVILHSLSLSLLGLGVMNVLWFLTPLASAEAFFTRNITIVSDQQEKPILDKATVQEFATVEIVGCLHPQPFRLDLQITSMMVFGFHSLYISFSILFARL